VGLQKYNAQKGKQKKENNEEKENTKTIEKK
jgi:hypothetical protein